jgi:hypothetical protein
MKLKQFAKNLAFGIASLALAGSAMAAPTYSFRIYAPGLCEGDSCATTSAPPPPSTDPYWSDVVSLLHMDGTNGSSTFTDQLGNTYTPSAASLSTANSMFGGSAGQFGGSSYIKAAASSNWNLTGDFTIEGFVNFSVLSTTVSSYTPTNQYIFDFGDNGTFLRYLGAPYSGMPTGWTLYGPGNAQILNYGGSAVTNHWYYWVVQRKGTTVSLFLDGSPVATGTYSGTVGGTSSTLTFGDYGGGSTYGLQGYLDEIRVTKGVARYSTGASAPASEFPND